MAKNDVVIKEMMIKVEEQKANLGVKERYVLKTNGIFKYEKGEYFNLNTVADPNVFVTALSYLLEKQLCFNEASTRLGVAGEFKYDGYSVEEWEEDFKNKIKGIEYEKNKKKLEDAKKKLATLISEEARTEIELESLKKSLGI